MIKENDWRRNVLKIGVKIKVSGIDELKMVIDKIKEIEKVNPHMSVDIEVDCRKKVIASS